MLVHSQGVDLDDSIRRTRQTARSRAVAVLRAADKRAFSAEDVHHAVAGDELLNHYQPKVNVETGKLVGVEALVRWQHPVLGLVYPDRFIGIAEQHGLIGDLTRGVLQRALADARRWRAIGLSLRMAVNVSMENLVRLDFPDMVAELAAGCEIPAGELLLEVTESRLLRDTGAVHDILSRLCREGIRLAIDDFGTGNSSLEQLRTLPFNQLKIDRSYVHGAHGNRTSFAIYTASQGMARELGMEIAAEGVEDRADWNFLRSRGCDIAQGYFIARPMSADALQEWVVEWRRRVHEEKLAPEYSTGTDGAS